MSTIENNVTAKEFRERVEDKNTLDKKGTLYVGTGGRNTEEPNAYKTVATPPPEENSVLVKDDTQEGGLGWKNIVDAVNAAAEKPQGEQLPSDVPHIIERAYIASCYKSGVSEYSYFSGTFSEINSKISDIEKRLMNLGFKEGSITLSGAIASSSVVQNKITRQGNYCLFNLDLSGVNISVDYQNPKFIGNLSSNFLPLETYYGNCYVSTDDTTDPFLLKISETGDVYLMESGTSSATISNLQAIGLGYEAKPLS